MHPMDHSRTSARLFGGTPEDYLHLHQWMDDTKQCFADFRHRALRHHSYGVIEAQKMFGDSITNSDGAVIEVHWVLEQHTKEDCGGRVPTTDDWLACMDALRWMEEDQREDDCAMSVRKWGGCLSDYVLIHGWMDETRNCFTDFRYKALRYHSYGIFEAEKVFGVSFTNSAGKQVHVRYVVEEHVKNHCGGKIPTVEDWLRNMTPQAWMSRGYPELSRA